MLVPRPISSRITSDRASPGEDCRCFHHLDHECGLAGGEVVLQADAGENAVNQADAGLGCRDEAAHLSQQRDQRHLPDVSRLASHVGAGQHQHPGLAGQLHIIGDIFAVIQYPLDYRMPAIPDAYDGIVVDRWPHVSVINRRLGQSAENIHLGNGGTGATNVRSRFGNLGADPPVYGLFFTGHLIAGVQHPGLVLFKLSHYVSLGVGEGLATDVVIAALPPGTGHFDVVAENLVVPTFSERTPVRSRSFCSRPAMYRRASTPASLSSSIVSENHGE